MPWWRRISAYWALIERQQPPLCVCVSLFGLDLLQRRPSLSSAYCHTAISASAFDPGGWTESGRDWRRGHQGRRRLLFAHNTFTHNPHQRSIFTSYFVCLSSRIPIFRSIQAPKQAQEFGRALTATRGEEEVIWRPDIDIARTCSPDILGTLV